MTCLDTYLSMAATEAGLDASLACCDRPRALLLGYLFGAFNLSDLQTRLLNTIGFSFERAIRREMIADKDVMCVMKFALYQTVAARHRYRTLPELRRYASSLGLNDHDMPLVELVVSHPGLSSHFDNLLQSGYRALTYAKFRAEVDRAVEDNSANTRSYAFHKLRFLANWGRTVDDSVTDCQSKAFEALLLRYPIFSSRVHFHNLYKLTVRQAGNKLIAHYTTQSRNVFDENGTYRKASMVIESADGEISAHDQGWGMPTSSLTGAGSDSTDEAAFQLHSLLRNPDLSAPDREFLTLLAGDTDDAFEAWMTEVHNVQDVERVINGGTKRYRRLVMEYLKYPSTRLRHIQYLLTCMRPQHRPTAPGFRPRHRHQPEPTMVTQLPVPVRF